MPVLSGTEFTVNVSVPTSWSRGLTLIVYVPVAGNVNVSRKAVAAEANNVATVEPLELFTKRSTPAIVLPVTRNVTFCPAFAAKVRSAFSPIVPIVTVVGESSAVVPVLFGTAPNVNVTVPTS